MGWWLKFFKKNKKTYVHFTKMWYNIIIKEKQIKKFLGGNKKWKKQIQDSQMNMQRHMGM